MATLRAAPTQPKSPQCLKKEGPAKRGEMEPLTPTTPQRPQAPSCSSCIKKKNRQHTYQQNAADSESNTKKTVVQAQGNSVLNSTAMSKELWITNGKDT